jgi:cupin 2 domain-containing protein
LHQPQPNNLFAGIPEEITQEIIEILLETPGFFLERIISGGQATPPGEWYDQDTHEWVVLLSGAAGLLFAGEDQARVMRPGDFVLIPAHCRHRVEWTAPDQNTVWLALHFRENTEKIKQSLMTRWPIRKL